jgi:hypothetical protein
MQVDHQFYFSGRISLSHSLYKETLIGPFKHDAIMHFFLGTLSGEKVMWIPM